jgi:hypothetical protein
MVYRRNSKLEIRISDQGGQLGVDHLEPSPQAPHRPRMQRQRRS